MAIKNNPRPAPPTEPEPIDWRNRQAEVTSYGGDFYPRVKGTMTRKDWTALFNAREGKRSPVGYVPAKARTLWDRPWHEVIREALFHDNVCLQPPADQEEALRMFAHQVALRTRDSSMATSGGGAAGAFSNLIGQWAVDGYREYRDTLSGIVENAKLPHFLPAPVAQILDLHSLKPLPKGGTAETGNVTIPNFGTWKLARFARRFVIDEQTLANDVPGLVRKSLMQLGRAARRAFSDLAWFQILSNPALAFDSQPLFCAAHGNYSSSAVLTDTALGAADAAIAGQVITGGPDSAEIVHLNLIPRYLIVPPALKSTALEILRLRLLDGQPDNIELRVESRLGPAGVMNPITGATVSGSSTNWLLSTDSSSPWILKGTREGTNGPTTRTSEIRPGTGQYGLAVDIMQDLACSLCDFRGVYFSAG